MVVPRRDRRVHGDRPLHADLQDLRADPVVAPGAAGGPGASLDSVSGTVRPRCHRPAEAGRCPAARASGLDELADEPVSRGRSRVRLESAERSWSRDASHPRSPSGAVSRPFAAAWSRQVGTSGRAHADGGRLRRATRDSVRWRPGVHALGEASTASYRRARCRPTVTQVASDLPSEVWPVAGRRGYPGSSTSAAYELRDGDVRALRERQTAAAPPVRSRGTSRRPIWSAASPGRVDFRRSRRQWISWVLGCRHSRIRYSKSGSSTIGIGSGDAGAAAPTTIFASPGMNGDCGSSGSVTTSTGSV